MVMGKTVTAIAKGEADPIQRADRIAARKYAVDIANDDLLSPFSKKFMPHLGQWERDGVFLCALLVVLIFAVIYSMGLVHSK
jgi:hypothetical protein